MYTQTYEKKHALNQVLNDIQNDFINLDSDETYLANSVLGKVMNILIPEMKNADLNFRVIYQDIHYSGSYYESLKVNTPDEFDLNVLLRFPINKNDLCVADRWSTEGEQMQVIPGHVFCCTKKNLDHIFHQSQHKGLYRFFEEENNFSYLSPCEIKSWFQSVVERALNNLRRDNRLFLGQDEIAITTSGSGPAWTLHIRSKSSVKKKSIDVDMVPVIPIWDPRTESTVYLVPKPPKDDDALQRLQWRLSYTKKEREILHNNSCAKKVIKLLKRLRDVQGAPWKKLCSYHLKNFVILEIRNYSWNERELGVIFISLLKRLHQYLSKGEMPSNFDEEHNIIFNVGKTTIENIKNKLDKINKDIKRNDPIEMRKYFAEEENNYEGQGSFMDGAISAEGSNFCNEIGDKDENLSPFMSNALSGTNLLVGAAVGAGVLVGIAGLLYAFSKDEEKNDKKK